MTVAEYLSERGLGPAEECLRLSGELQLPGGATVSASLCLLPSGAYVVAASSRFVGRLELVRTGHFTYEPGRLRDHVRLAEERLGIPQGKAEAARRLIARGRLRSERGAQPLGIALVADRLVQRVAVEAWELSHSVLAEDDELIALVALEGARMRSALGAEAEERRYFALSMRGAWLLRSSELGDHDVTRLSEPELAERDGETTVGEQTERFAVPRKARTLLLELLELARLPAAERATEAARRLWLDRGAGSVPVRGLALLDRAASDAYAPAVIARWALSLREQHGGRGTALNVIQALRGANAADRALADVFESFRLEPALAEELLLELSVLGRDAEPFALELHRALREGVRRATRDQADPERDLALAEHELTSGSAIRARDFAARALSRMPPDEGDVHSPELTTPARSLRLRLHEIMVREASQRGDADVRALAALARLEPSSEPRLRALANAKARTPEEAALVARAEQVLGALGKGGLAHAAAAQPDAPTEPLTRTSIEQFVRHPLSRGGRLATRLSELIAAVPEPDLGFLRDFCEELSDLRYPEADRALARCSALLGLPKVSGYVSHGARSVGLRAFGADEPFILVGERQLLSGSAYLLVGAELDFAFGAELSHLALGHQRVTSREIWAGAAGKTRDALSALSIFVPLLSELAGPRAQRILTRVGSEALQQAAQRAGRLPEWIGDTTPNEGPAIGQRNEDLIAAHRLMQLSADRAGLIACRNLCAAVRAVLLTRADYRELLQAAQTDGLFRALAERHPGDPALQDLELRLRALIAFYLSFDYDAVLRPGYGMSLPASVAEHAIQNSE